MSAEIELRARLYSAETHIAEIRRFMREIEAGKATASRLPEIVSNVLFSYEYEAYRREVCVHLRRWDEAPVSAEEVFTVRAAFDAGTAAIDVTEQIVLDRQ